MSTDREVAQGKAAESGQVPTCPHCAVPLRVTTPGDYVHICGARFILHDDGSVTRG